MRYRSREFQNDKRYSGIGGYDLQPITGLGGIGGSPGWAGSVGLNTIGLSPSISGYGSDLGTTGVGTAGLYGIGGPGGGLSTGLGYSGFGGGLFNASGRYGTYGGYEGLGGLGSGISGLGAGLLGLGTGLLGRTGFGGLGILGYPAGRRWYGYYNSPYIYYNRRPFVYY